MKHSTVTTGHDQEFTDVAKAVRGAMGEERITASDLARQFGGAVSYWTRRSTGQIPFSDRDLDLIARATGRHPAEFFGGQAPVGWRPAPFPRGVDLPATETGNTGSATPTGGYHTPSRRYLAAVA